jgi:hypothetical protein
MHGNTRSPPPLPREWRISIIAFPLLVLAGILLHVAERVFYPDDAPPCRYRMPVLLTVWSAPMDCPRPNAKPPPTANPPLPEDKLAADTR